MRKFSEVRFEHIIAKIFSPTPYGRSLKNILSKNNFNFKKKILSKNNSEKISLARWGGGYHQEALAKINRETQNETNWDFSTFILQIVIWIFRDGTNWDFSILGCDLYYFSNLSHFSRSHGVEFLKRQGIIKTIRFLFSNSCFLLHIINKIFICKAKTTKRFFKNRFLTVQN